MKKEEFSEDEVKWSAEPIIGQVLIMQSKDMHDSRMNKIHPNLKYYVGKHIETGMLIILPAEEDNNAMLNDSLLKSGRLN